MAWINYQLGRGAEKNNEEKKKVVTDLFYDLRDGHILISLLEVCSRVLKI